MLQIVDCIEIAKQTLKEMNSHGTADCQLLHLADYGTMPPGQGAHEGRKARGL